MTAKKNYDLTKDCDLKLDFNTNTHKKPNRIRKYTWTPICGKA